MSFQAIRFHASRHLTAASAVAILLAPLACGGGGSTGPAERTEPPRITRLDPLEGRVGFEVRIFGEGFGTDPEAIEVTFGGERAAVAGIDATSVRAVVPEIEVGQAEVVVTVEGLDSNPGTFRVKAAPFARPPDESMSGRWMRTLVRTAADDGCPDPLPEREVVELRIDSAELVLGEASGEVTFDGTWRATGSVAFDDGSAIRIIIEARFVIESGRLAIVGELVREHLAPDGSTTCTETYDLRLDRA